MEADKVYKIFLSEKEMVAVSDAMVLLHDFMARREIHFSSEKSKHIVDFMLKMKEALGKPKMVLVK